MDTSTEVADERRQLADLLAVRGGAEALLLAMTGRPTALEHLRGDGLPTLHARLSGTTR